jgi:D-arabinose 1-dehydrogenase-like Zn-dependent alcohol dehydrogenase
VFKGRIARFDAPGKPFEIETVSLPEVGPGQILVRVNRANICGSDLHAWHGTFATRGLGGQLPTVLGHEMVGAVEALGEGVSADSNGAPLDVGTRVVFPYFFCCHTCRNCLAGRRNACLNLKMAMLGRADEPPYFVGGYGDYFLLPAGAVVYTVPDAVSDDVAAGANCALSQVMYGLDASTSSSARRWWSRAQAHSACMRSRSPRRAELDASSPSTGYPNAWSWRRPSAPTT